MKKLKNSIKRCDTDNDVEDVEERSGDEKPYQYFETEVRSRNMAYYISEELEAPRKYAEMVHNIRTAGSDDRITLYLNTSGGQTNTGVQLINAMRQSEASITTVLDAEAYSMGTFLFLAGQNKQVGDHAMLMFHDYSGEPVGNKGNEQYAELEMARRWYGKLMRDICIPFLTSTEVDQIMAGKDLWMDSDEIRARLDKVEAARLREEKKAAAAVRKPVKRSAPAASKTTDE